MFQHDTVSREFQFPNQNSLWGTDVPRRDVTVVYINCEMWEVLTH